MIQGERSWKRDDDFVNEARYALPPCNGIYISTVFEKTLFTGRGLWQHPLLGKKDLNKMW